MTNLQKKIKRLLLEKIKVEVKIKKIGGRFVALDNFITSPLLLSKFATRLVQNG